MADSPLTTLSQESPGVLCYGGARMALLEIQSGFWSLRKQIEALIGPRLTNSVLQQSGANGGAAFAAIFAGSADSAARRAGFEACLQAYQAAGFGKFTIADMQWPVGRVVIHAEEAVEAWMARRHNQQPEAPLCSYTAGVLVGFVNVIAGRHDVVCVEHACQALGAERCVFELLPAAESGGAPAVAMAPDPTLGRQINLLEMLFERMPMGIVVFDRQFRVARCNPTWADFIERYTPSQASDVIPGKRLEELAPGAENYFYPAFRRVLAGETVRMEGMQAVSGGIESFWDVAFSPLYENNQITGILEVTTDATERVQALHRMERRVKARTQEIERRQEVAESLREMLKILNSGRSSAEIFAYITAQSAELLGADSCLLYSLQGQRLTQEAGYNLPQALVDLGTGDLYDGPANKKLMRREQVIVSNAEQHLSGYLAQTDLTGFQRAWVEVILANFKAYIGAPLIVRDQMFGGMIIYYKETREFSQEDVQLASAFADQAALAIENARLHQMEQARQRELQMLLDVAAAANSSLELDEMLQTTLDRLVALVGASRAGVLLRSPESGELEARMLRPERSITPADLAQMIAACQTVLEGGEMLYIHPDRGRGFIEPGALLPLKARGQPLGVLGIIGAEGDVFSQAQLALFQSIADQLSVAVENARLYEQAEQAAVAMERSRLARDLHDAVTQTLFSASLIAEVLPKLWGRDPDAGRQKLDELRVLTRGALSEMRTLLLELRPDAFGDVDLGDLYRHLTNAFTGRTRIPVTFNQAGHAAIPLAIKETFYRMAQEALNNIGKHAEATQVQVDLSVQDNEVDVQIRDNGCGFDLAEISPENMGLKIMRERAESIHAHLDISSAPGAGTQVHMRWRGAQEEQP